MTSASDFNQSQSNESVWMITQEQLDFLMFYETLWKIIAPTIFILIIAVGATGNLLVVYVIVSNPRMRSVTNLLLLNLAVCDLAYLFICVPSTAYKFIADNYELGEVTCQIFGFFSYVSAYVAIYTLVAISIIRYLTILQTNAPIGCLNQSNIIFFTVSLWITMMALNIPTFLAHTKKTVGYYTYCGMEREAIEPIFVTFFLFAYAVPLIVICLLYLRIGNYLHSQKPTTFFQRRTRERNTRTLRLITLVVASFGIAWLPYHVNTLLSHFGKLPQGYVYEIFRIVSMSMSFGNSCMNPFIYNCAAEDFRRGFKRAVCCECGRGKKNKEKKEKESSKSVERTNVL